MSAGEINAGRALVDIVANTTPLRKSLSVSENIIYQWLGDIGVRMRDYGLGTMLFGGVSLTPFLAAATAASKAGAALGDVGGIMGERFAARLDAWNRSMDNIRTSMLKLTVSVGSALNEAIAPFVNKLSSLVDVAAAFVRDNEQIILYGARYAATFAAAGAATTAAGSALSYLASMSSIAAKAIVALNIAMAYVVPNMGAIASATVSAGRAVAASVPGLMAWLTTASPAFAAISSAIGSVLSALWATVAPVLAGVAATMSGVVVAVGLVALNIRGILQYFNDVFSGYGDIFSALIIEPLQEVFGLLWDMASFFEGIFFDAWSILGDNAGRTLHGIADTIRTVVGGALDWLRGKLIDYVDLYISVMELISEGSSALPDILAVDSGVLHRLYQLRNDLIQGGVDDTDGPGGMADTVIRETEGTFSGAFAQAMGGGDTLQRQMLREQQETNLLLRDIRNGGTPAVIGG